MANTIILRHGIDKLTNREYKKFEKGDTIWGEDSASEEIQRWDISQEEEAKAELTTHTCSYKTSGYIWDIDEWALEYSTWDEDGEFVDGCDFDLAEEEKEI